jgi:adenylate cyclase
MSERLGEADLFAALDRYFEAVVEAVRGRGGDVLKFLGDGVLAIFPVEASRTDACRAALEAVAEARERLAGAAAADDTPLAFIATFTVLGPAVNLVSRLEGVAKELSRPLLCSAAFAAALDAPLASLGRFALKGVAEPEEVFAPAAPDGCGSRQGAVVCRGRARRWMTPPVPGFTTALLLPGPLPSD